MDSFNIARRFPGKKIVVIGDIMVDEYIKGSVTRISPEMPVPLLLRSPPSADEKLVRLGGAGNTARNLASLGAEVILIGVSGKTDSASVQLHKLADEHRTSQNNINELQIDCRIVAQDDILTTHKLRLLNNQLMQLFRIDTESYQIISKETMKEVLNHIMSATQWCDAVVVTDYAKGLITRELINNIRFYAGDKKLIADPKETESGLRFYKYKRVDIIIPNESELRNSFDYHESSHPLEALFSGELQSSLDDFGIKSILCTRGENGIMFSDCTIDKAESRIGKPVEVADVTGASDTVTAAVALACAVGADLATIAEIAEAAGRIKVTKRMTGTVGIDELLKVLSDA